MPAFDKTAVTVSPELEAALTEIAVKHFFVETLETRKNDSLDFKDTAVWAMRDALIEAYFLGRRTGAELATAKAA